MYWITLEIDDYRFTFGFYKKRISLREFKNAVKTKLNDSREQFRESGDPRMAESADFCQKVLKLKKAELQTPDDATEPTEVVIL